MIDFFKGRRQKLLQLKVWRENAVQKKNAPSAQDVFEQCPECNGVAAKADWTKNLSVCPECGHHRPLGAYQRLALLLDQGSFRELNENLVSGDPLTFEGYAEKKKSLQKRSGLQEAIVTAKGQIEGITAIVAVMDGRFLMGSMGIAVGEKVARAAETAAKEKLPLIIFCASGGARMQEGILSLMQMAKTAAAIEKFQQNGGLYIACLTHPTTGGVTASFASLGDFTLAEPNALIGFAGPRVIEQTIGQELPEGFQRAEYLEEHGFIDAVVPRAAMKATLGQLLRLHRKGGGHRG